MPDTKNWIDEETALVLRSQAGDLDAFGVLVTRHETRILRLIGQILGDSATGQDLNETAMAVFTAAWRDLRGLHAPGEFPMWLSRRAIQAALRRPLRGAPEPADALPRWERAAVRLHFTGRYTAAEIGYLLERSTEDVWAMLYTGCRRLAAEKTETACTEPG